MSKTKIQDNTLEELDKLCQSIAQIEHDNWAIIERYKIIQDQIDSLLAASAKKHGEPLASESAIRKRVAKFREMLGPVRKPRSVSGQAMKQRLTMRDKTELTLAMVSDFDKRGVEEVTLDDINKWLDEPRKDGKADIRDDLKVRGIHISQVRWFELTVNVKKRDGTIKQYSKPLYPKDCYKSKGAGAKSTFNIKKWKKDLIARMKENERVNGVGGK